MNNIIFLDIDGVLNCAKDFKINSQKKKQTQNSSQSEEQKKLSYRILDINLEKLKLLIQLANQTNSKVVMISSWKNLKIYPEIEKWMMNQGLPIIGTTSQANDRGEEIRNYIKKHHITNFVIIDDEIFKDYNELLENLVKTDFYQNGFNQEHMNQAIKILKKGRNTK